jgi:hypothetical protein
VWARASFAVSWKSNGPVRGMHRWHHNQLSGSLLGLQMQYQQKSFPVPEHEQTYQGHAATPFPRIATPLFGKRPPAQQAKCNRFATTTALVLQGVTYRSTSGASALVPIGVAPGRFACGHRTRCQPGKNEPPTAPRFQCCFVSASPPIQVVCGSRPPDPASRGPTSPTSFTRGLGPWST